MSCSRTITIDGVEYVQKNSVEITDTEIKICVLDKGFVYIGKPVLQKDGLWLITQARCIRYWGTTKGLGELKNGPTKQTKMDDLVQLRVPNSVVQQFIDVDQSQWAKHL